MKFYSIRYSQSVGNFLAVPKFHPSTEKFVKKFGYGFAFDTYTFWNALPDEICASPSIIAHLSLNMCLVFSVSDSDALLFSIPRY